MQGYVGVTDYDWYDLLRRQNNLAEVNFWQPSGNNQFRALKPGELFLFKLHSPNNFIVGGGVYAHSSLLPISLAWESFGVGNGASSYLQMRRRVEKYRRQGSNRINDYILGCILLEQPFFLEKSKWIPVPADWKPNIVQGRRYDFRVEPGMSLWKEIQAVMGKPLDVREEVARYGAPVLTLPRLGQGSFRVLITDVYNRRCALTGERTLPALEAAHIKPYAELGDHKIENGLLMRRDLHALFDTGYITVTPYYNIEVSRKIKEEFENGKDYYRLQGNNIRLPDKSIYYPLQDNLRWHNENIYRG